MAPSIDRVRLTNYKSIQSCDVELGPLNVLVGRNGAGKSNFVDALLFVSESLRETLARAIAKRGSFLDITYQRSRAPIGMEISFRTRQHVRGKFGFTLENGVVREEHLTLASGSRYLRSGSRVTVWNGDQKVSAESVAPDALALGPLSSFIAAFRDAFESLASTRAYSRLDPEAMLMPRKAGSAETLDSDGSNLTNVWGTIAENEPLLADRLTSYAAAIAPSIRSISRLHIDTYDVLMFRQDFGGREVAMRASNISDGTLRALAILVAATVGPFTVMIEEPETALHPGGVAVLMDALHEAAEERQIVITTHSPDVLDRVALGRDTLLVAEMRNGATVLAPVDAASAAAIRTHLYTPGDLLRMDQLQASVATE